MAEEYDNEENESEGVKSLRKALAKREAEAAEKDKLLGELLKESRSRKIADKFTEFKINPKIAKMVPSDIELEKLDEWIGENADWLGVDLSKSDDNQQEQNSQRRISGFETQSSDSTDEPDLRAVNDTKSAQELKELIFARQMGHR